ncbi:MAG: hypothetical protein IKN66_13945 [Ruminococcus sp.]|nr:hypothetical protein [Ruminococcus sp.]
MRFHCTIGKLQEKLEYLLELFGDRIKGENVSINGLVGINTGNIEIECKIGTEPVPTNTDNYIFRCTLGDLDEKLYRLMFLFDDKVKLDYILYDGSPTYFIGANGSECRHQVFNYLLRFPSLGLVLREGYDCSWHEDEQKLYQLNQALYVCSQDGEIEHICFDTVDELINWYVKTEHIEIEDQNNIECVIEMEFEADV